MKAIVYTAYGPPDVLRLEDVPKPVPGDHDLMIRVHAATVNRTDCGFRNPRPFFVRLFSGLFRPKRHVLGNEYAGVVEDMGAGVNSFNRGDRVFGLTGVSFGTHAEYVCVPEQGSVAPMPSIMGFDEAAAVCDGATLALSSLRAGCVRDGQKVLVYGASGSIGTAAVQLAKYYGAEVTAVCNTKNVEIVRSLGADRVIDYTQKDFTAEGLVYDVIFDSVGKSSFMRCKKALKKGGIFLETDLGFLWQNVFFALVTAIFRSRRLVIATPKESKENILFFKKIIEEGRYRAVIDRRYPLERIVEATRYVETEQKTGNVVIIVRAEGKFIDAQ